MKIIVVGGVALGATFATRMSRLNGNTEITIFEKSSYISYANCGLPYNLDETITMDKLVLTSPEEIKKRLNIDVFVDTEVVSFDKKNKTVTTRNTKTNEEKIYGYDKLILGPGARSLDLPIKGLKEETSSFPLKNINDLEKIKDFMAKTNPKNAIIIGAGFIGLEVAETLASKGLNVTVVEAKNTILKLDEDMSYFAENELEANKVRLIKGAAIKEVSSDKKVMILGSGEEVPYDIIFATAGLKPNTEFIKEAGIEVDDRGIVVTNEFMQTSDQDVYAGGDIVYTPHLVTGKKVYSPLAWGANRQAKVIANHIYGIKDAQPATAQTAIIKIFRLPVAQTGLTEFEAKMEKINYDKVFVSLNHHAGYYPGAMKVNVKLIFEKETNRVLGAQAIGPSADKKMDIIATALKAKMTLNDLLDLNLSYSPPYGSALDVINTTAAVALNKIALKFETKEARELSEKDYVIDVRPKEVFELGSLSWAKNIPLTEIRGSKSLPKDKDKEIHVLCNTGRDSYNALNILRALGYTKLVNIYGGYQLYHTIEKASTNGALKFNAKEVIKTAMKGAEMSKDIQTIVVDCKGLSCPGPIMKLHKTLKDAKDGEVFDVEASDFGFADDIVAWVAKNGHTLVNVESTDTTVKARIIKGQSTLVSEDSKALAKAMIGNKEHATIVLFSGEYDKAIAAFIIAQAAASLGKKVTIFATFWGLNALRVKPKKKPKKKFMKKMFGAMMPMGVEAMPLSRMNMGGMGKAIIKSTMKKHNVASPSEMLNSCLEVGVEIIACTMSMELLGITKEELVSGTTFAGAAKYVAQSDDSNITLFI